MSDLLWAAIIAAVAPTATVALSHWRQSKKIAEVHDLANNRLTEALEKIERLTTDIATLKAQK